jgi:hypothetical protein
MLRSAGDTRAIYLRISCFALSGEVSLIQTDHVPSEEPAYSNPRWQGYACSPTNKACVPRALYISHVACIFPHVAPLALLEVVPVLKA